MQVRTLRTGTTVTSPPNASRNALPQTKMPPLSSVEQPQDKTTGFRGKVIFEVLSSTESTDNSGASASASSTSGNIASPLKNSDSFVTNGTNTNGSASSRNLLTNSNNNNSNTLNTLPPLNSSNEIPKLNRSNTSYDIPPALVVLLEENSICAECSAQNPTWASINLGVFLCIECSGIHRSLGVHLSKVRSVELDEWDEPTIEFMQQMGNIKANAIWEFDVPSNYTKPQPNSPRGSKETWINAKYKQKIFVDPDVIKAEEPSEAAPTKKKTRKDISQINKEGFLIKRGAEKILTNWHRRWFVLKGKYLYYYFTREDGIPIGAIHLENATVKVTENPEKKFSFSLITPGREYILVAEDSSDLFTWMTAIREGIDCSVPILNPTQLVSKVTEASPDVAQVTQPKSRFSVNLTKRHSFALNYKHVRNCGYLFKKGNQKIRKDWKSRYCVLYKNSLYYYEHQTADLPLGIIDLEMVNLVSGKTQNGKYYFDIETPSRAYYFYAESSEHRDKWLKYLRQAQEPILE